MFDRVLVPLDGSLPATDALIIGEALAKRMKAKLHVLAIVESGRASSAAEGLIERQVARIDSNPTVDVRPLSYSIAEDIAAEHDSVDRTLLVMQTWARGRSAGIVGNISERVLKLTRSPLIALGPDVQSIGDPLSGPLFITTDGSHFGDSAVSFAAELSKELSIETELITVIDPATVPAGAGVAGESNALVGLAGSVRAITGHEVNYDVLHNTDPAEAIVDHARHRQASFIAMSTHGRSGFARVTEDSVAMKVIRHAHCPVILNRPPSDEH